MNMEMIKAKNRAAGQHFFDRDTMRFFRSKVYPKVYGGKYFITAEQVPGMPVAFSVREALDSGNIRTIGGFNSLRTLEDAKDTAQAMAVTSKSEVA